VLLDEKEAEVKSKESELYGISIKGRYSESVSDLMTIIRPFYTTNMMRVT